MYHDVTEFRNFYYRTRLGRSVQRRLQLEIKELWPETKGDCLIGFGFSSPFLRPLRGRFRHMVNLMPEGQGVMAWPPGEQNISALCHETAWPLGAGVADFAVIAHAIECSEDVSGLLNEIWRVLAPEGRALVIVSNRMGIWGNSDATPFGFGRPYSLGQLERLFAKHQFEVSAHRGALFAPPMVSNFGLKSVGLLEWLLRGKSRTIFAGALILEVRKHVGIMPPKLRKSEPIFANPALLPSSSRRQKTLDSNR